MSRLIPLSRGKSGIVDDVDYDRLIAMGKWTYHGEGYAYRWDRTSKPPKCILMHRIVAGTLPGLDTDHINGDKLDNRRCNLRPASRTLNSLNKVTRGAYVQRNGKSYSVELRIAGQKIWIGRIGTAEEANHIHQDIKHQIMEVV